MHEPIIVPEKGFITSISIRGEVIPLDHPIPFEAGMDIIERMRTDVRAALKVTQKPDVEEVEKI